MGFDRECIINIQTYPGEYFCPVCRTLVYPNEESLSQCRHLYCKPCLAHIANGSKACPYDGYLVTEADSKPRIDSDRILAEKIGNVKVHCLFFRSGCTWEGTLSDCTSHCSECSFGCSAVICNRCGIQIVHRRVHDHAQSCSGQGVYEAKQAIEGVPGATSSSTALSTTTATVNLTTAQSGQPLSQPQNSRTLLLISILDKIPTSNLLLTLRLFLCKLQSNGISNTTSSTISNMQDMILTNSLISNIIPFSNTSKIHCM